MLIHERAETWHGRDQLRVVILPYVANWYLSGQRALNLLALRESSAREINLYFRGSIRTDSLRPRLDAVNWTSLNSIYELGTYARIDSYEERQRIAIEYSRQILRSRFCLVPRGDSPTSRRLFDAVAGGCLPVILSDEIRLSLPFSRHIPYDLFCTFLSETALRTAELLQNALRNLSTSLENSTLDEMQRTLLFYRPLLMYGYWESNATTPTPTLATAFPAAIGVSTKVSLHFEQVGHMIVTELRESLQEPALSTRQPPEPNSTIATTKPP